MEASLVSNLVIQSHKGPYSVAFFQDISDIPWKSFDETHFFIIDKKVFEIYQNILKNFIDSNKVICIEALEDNKNLAAIPKVIEELTNKSVKRNYTLVAIGGGIIQDITCFIASTIFRGIKWKLIPTTLLAQADSCIGSKSSINVNGIKNLVGNFYPPQEIYIASGFLKTLNKSEILSGIGEMLKVHIIDGSNSFAKIKESYGLLFSDEKTLLAFIRNSLKIKKKVIEIDEFDQGYRNIMNYGHTFGHAIETATNYKIPHGIAVSLGMDVANFFAASVGKIERKNFDDMHTVLRDSYKDFINYPVHFDSFKAGIKKDKKNIGTNITIIIPTNENGKTCEIKKHEIEGNDFFFNLCQTFLKDQGLQLI